jgi:hemerythrin-like domain-containing protein
MNQLNTLFQDHHKHLRLIESKDLAGIEINSIIENFKIQEKFFQKTSGVSRSLDQLAEELKEEHTAIIELCSQLEEAENATQALEILNVMGMLIKKHIRNEEHVYFEKVRNRFSEEQINGFIAG